MKEVTRERRIITRHSRPGSEYQSYPAFDLNFLSVRPRSMQLLYSKMHPIQHNTYKTLNYRWKTARRSMSVEMYSTGAQM